MTLQLLKKRPTTVPSTRLGVVLFFGATIFCGSATAQFRAQTATWNTNSTDQTLTNTSGDVKPGKRLSWGAGGGEIKRVEHASAFTEITPPQRRSPSEPGLFPSSRSENETERLAEQNARQVARIQLAASRQRVRMVSGESDLHQPAQVAGRIAPDGGLFGDRLTAPSITGTNTDPHLDPFGDSKPAPISLTPVRSFVEPFQPKTDPLPVIPAFEPIQPLETVNAVPSVPLSLDPAPEPIPDFEPAEPIVIPQPEPIALPEPEPVAIPEPEPVAIPEPEPVVIPEPETVAVPQPEPVVAIQPKALAPIPSRTPIPAPSSPPVVQKIRQPLQGIERSGEPLKANMVRPSELTQIGPQLPVLPPPAPKPIDPFSTDEPQNVPEFPEYQGDGAKAPEAADLPSPKDADTADDLPDIEEPPRPGDENNDLMTFPEREGDDGQDNEETEEPTPDDEEDEGTEKDDEEEDDEEDDDEEDDASTKRKVPCDRVYNDRNCCAQDQLCNTTTTKLLETRIQDLSVSITPPLVPLAEDETEVEEQRERLAESPIHDWTNRQGTLIATGRLVDFKDEAVIVETTSGGRVAIPYFNLGHDDLCFLTAWWRLPGECLLAGDDRAMRNFQASTFTWKAAAVCHKPLYFEEVQLERYGHSAGPVLQPLLSTAHFISNIQLFPYNMGVYPPNECRYTLGHYRPGSCAPWLIPAFPLSNRGVAWEIGAAFGLWGLF